MTEGGDWCIVMELMPDGDLQTQLAKRNFKPFSERATRHVIKQVLPALAFLHKNQIIHRDIKLENIVMKVTNDGCVAKLADFGFSEPVSSDQRTAQIIGSRGYFAPEVVRCESYGTASDIWSLGCLIYTMLTAQLYGSALG